MPGGTRPALNRKSRKCTIPALETRNFETVNWTCLNYTGPICGFEISGFQCGNRALSRFPILKPVSTGPLHPPGLEILEFRNFRFSHSQNWSQFRRKKSNILVTTSDTNVGCFPPTRVL